MPDDSKQVEFKKSISTAWPVSVKLGNAVGRLYDYMITRIGQQKEIANVSDEDFFTLYESFEEPK